ncbi:MAG TPA: hypothetical protein VHB21_22680, partial [Minicystis sp.]|nr:hypothetical protein [Minicystis sp.]
MCTADAGCGENERCVADGDVSRCVCKQGFVSCAGVCTDVEHDALHCGACLTACGAGDVCSGGICGATATPAPARPFSVGSGCDGRTPCMEGSSCVDGTCVCDAGKTACGAGCVDLQADWRACGGCGQVCLGTCVNGVCQTSAPVSGHGPNASPSSAPTFQRFDVSPNPSSVCTEAVEPYVERSANTNQLFASDTFAASLTTSQKQLNDNFDVSGAWQTADHQIPQGSGSTAECAFADSWLATSSSIGLELFPNDGRPDCGSDTGSTMLSLAGTTTGHWSNPANWDHFTHSVPTGDSAFDGPSAIFDDAYGRMWVTADDFGGPHVWWTDTGCTGYPGQACAWHDTAISLASPTDGHSTIALHPLGGTALLAFHDKDDNIRLLQLSALGSSLVVLADMTV